MLKLLRLLLLIVPIVGFSAGLDNKTTQKLFTFSAVINVLESNGYNHIKTIHQHSKSVYEVCAGKNSVSTDLFLIESNGTVKITVTNIDVIPYSWSPQEVRKANDVFIKKVKHMPTYFEIVAVNTAAMSDSVRETMWHYSKNTNVIK